MADIPLNASQRWRSLAAAIGVTSIVGTAMGLTWPLLAMVLDRQGVDGALIGLSSSCQTLAILAASPLAPRITAVTPEASRGRTIGVFWFLWAAGFGIGPLLIRLTSIEGWAPFLVAIALILAASAPLAFASDT